MLLLVRPTLLLLVQGVLREVQAMGLLEVTLFLAPLLLPAEDMVELETAPEEPVGLVVEAGEVLPLNLVARGILHQRVHHKVIAAALAFGQVLLEFQVAVAVLMRPQAPDLMLLELRLEAVVMAHQIAILEHP